MLLSLLPMLALNLTGAVDLTTTAPAPFTMTTSPILPAPSDVISNPIFFGQGQTDTPPMPIPEPIPTWHYEYVYEWAYDPITGQWCYMWEQVVLP